MSAQAEVVFFFGLVFFLCLARIFQLMNDVIKVMPNNSLVDIFYIFIFISVQTRLFLKLKCNDIAPPLDGG